MLAITVIAIAALLATLAVLAPVVLTERLLSAAATEATECRYAAQAAVWFAIAELQSKPSFDAVLDGTEIASVSDGTRAPVVSGVRPVDLEALAAGFPITEPGAWGPDTPRWRLFAWGPSSSLAQGAVASPVYVAAWVSDDEQDGDGDPARDANGRVRVRGEAYGALGGHRVAIATVQRELPAPAALRLLDWRSP